ncbi:diaminopimelate epimerase [Erythrobacter sp.]|jgi:diaminopimelate epimerase|uniref:diaminopimelate epimerase n=1 Tax=Erythrobacter sp. TaxID=1042 RepID=UPI002E9A4D2E|nr:diaminopimelate epimerase [Erythrobacter sp.]
MRVPFIKMHGLGNDFIVLDAREEALPAMSAPVAARLADRRAGIGCDQLILLEASETDNFRMRIFNSDGGEVEACGNAARAVALLHGAEAVVETAGGTIALRPGNGEASVDMGRPRFSWEEIPLAYAMDTGSLPLAWGPLAAPTAINVGNPHVVFLVEDVAAIDLAHWGPEIEQDPVFPEGINVNVVSLAGHDHLRLTVWERGAGLTRACGTGACASAVAAIRRGLVKDEVRVSLPGGDLFVNWREGEAIEMRGPASEAFRGSFDWEQYA